ncbi:putative Purine permease 10 [Hibiscus syriacus]|uniref:Purine permease 10 n=1 Tax=Hibiscus syriacus TaxID=106335 RepID=A0A6A3AD44_HIBSY|nr:putative Purine permease 10 [Hibiscus syriacus]
MLSRLHFEKGGTRKWVSALRLFAYVYLGLLLAGNSYLYEVAFQYLPVSTVALISASQLAFNAFFSYFLNSQKFTPFIINSLFLLTISFVLLVANNSSERPAGVSNEKYVVGFMCAIFGTATYGLILTSQQLTFRKTKMDVYLLGRTSYVTTLVGTAVSWQAFVFGGVALVFEISALFSNVIGVLGLPFTPIASMLVFHDEISSIKGISTVLAIWGSISYACQQYLDDRDFDDEINKD